MTADRPSLNPQTVSAAMPSAPRCYPMAALIRLTLISLYLALVLPLPLLAPGALRPWMALAVPAGLVLVLAITSERVELDDQGLRVGHPPWCSWCLRRGWSLRWEAISGLTPVATSQGGRVFYVRSQGRGAPNLGSPPTRADGQTTANAVDGDGAVIGDAGGASVGAGSGTGSDSGSSTGAPGDGDGRSGGGGGGGGRSYLLPQRIAGFDDFLSRFSAASGIDTRSVGRITPPWTYQLLALLSGLLLIAEIGMVSFGPFGLWVSTNQGLG